MLSISGHELKCYCLSSFVCQFKKNKVRDYTDSDSDCDEDQEDRGLILRQVTFVWVEIFFFLT